MNRDQKLHSLMAGILLILFVPSAQAVKWVEVFTDDENEMFAEVDVDSIRKADDGLVYFTESTDIGSHDKAVDCQKHILYLLKDGSWEDPNWRSNGNDIVPGSNGSKIADFVCARAS